MDGITYTKRGDCLIPDIILSDPPNAPPLGLYGMKHKEYLREHKPALYASLLLTERLYPLCRKIDESAKHRVAVIADREQAQEIINELIYD